MPPRPITRTTSYLCTRLPTRASPGGAAGGLGAEPPSLTEVTVGEEPGSVRVVMAAPSEAPFAPYQRKPAWSWRPQTSGGYMFPEDRGEKAHSRAPPER